MTRYATYPSLNGKSVFITGGGSGIGAAMVQAFCEQGAQVGFVDIDTQAAESLLKILASFGLHADFMHCDVADINRLHSAIDTCAQRQGSIDVLINNVANDQRHDPDSLEPADWHRLMAVNLDAAFFAATRARQHMRNGSSIVNISSINALWGPDDMPAYVIAKSGLLGMTKSLARKYGSAGIRVNSVLPGWVETARQRQLWLSEAAEAEWKALLCIKKLLSPEDIARLVLFLSADDSALITAQHYIIDCGRI